MAGAILYKDKVYGVGGSIIEGYYKSADGKFYEESTYETEIVGAEDLLYIDLSTKMQFIYDGTNFVNITEDAKPTVTGASSRTNIASGDTLKTIIGKIKKFFADLKAVAFSGAYSDLTGKPTKLSDFTNDLTSFVIKSGDTMTGDLNITNGGESDAPLHVIGKPSGTFIEFFNLDGETVFGRLGIKSDHLPYLGYQGNKRIALLEECATPSDVEGSKTATGSIVTVTDAADIYAEEVDVAVVATQTGSGTPSPSNIRPIQGYDIVSVDRCGKNLINPSEYIGRYEDKSELSSTINGNVLTIYAPTGNNRFIGFVVKVVTGQTYTLSLQSSNKEVTGRLNFTDTKPTVSSLYAGEYFLIERNTSLNKTFTALNEWLEIMIEPSGSSGTATAMTLTEFQLEKSDQKTTYESFDSQTVSLQLGNKNLLPMTVEGIKAANTDSAYVWSGNTCIDNGMTFTILTDENGLVTGIKANGTASDNIGLALTPYFTIDKDCVVTGSPSGASDSTYFIQLFNSNPWVNVRDYGSGANVASGSTFNALIYIRSGQTLSNKIFYPMLRSASVTDATFSPYNPTLGSMVYGGQLTLNDDGSAVFVGDRVYREFTANDSNTWNLLSGYSNTFYCAWTKDSIAPTATGTDGVCSSYNVVRKATSSLANGEITLNNTGISSSYSSACVKDTQYSTAANFKASLTTPLQIVYPLATPFTIHLSAEQLKLLQGTNNVWSNAGDVTLKYQPDNVIAEPKGEVQQLYSKSVIQKDVLYQKGSANTNPDTITLAKPCTNYDLLIVRIIIINSGAPTYTVDCTFNVDGLLTNCIFCNASSGSTRFVAYIVTDSMTLTKSSVSQNCFLKTIWGVKFTL